MSIKDQPKRLGRGLAALMGEASAPVAPDALGVRTLPVELLEPSPFQPRREMDETALNELADSITQRGVLQPLLVRPKPGHEGYYQIIAGERRWRAAQKARLHEVPVLVRPLSDSDAMAAGLVENLQREDLNPVEEAQGYERLMKEFNMTQDEMGAAIGKSRSHITHALRILKLPERVLGLVRDGTLSAGHARALVPHVDPLKGARDIVARQLTVRQTEEMVNNLGRSIHPSQLKAGASKGNRSSEIDEIEKSLNDTLGLKVKIVHGGTKGSITVHYDDFYQMDLILSRLNRA
jgi:ParB family chromosome partitioning protein